MSQRNTIPVIAIMQLAVASVGAQEYHKGAVPLAPVQILEGLWRGKGEGFGQTSQVTRKWDRVLGGKFMRL